MNRTRFLPLLVAIVLPWHLAAQERDPAAEVRAAEAAFAQTMADRDLDAFMTFVADDAIFFTAPEPLRGKAAVRAWWSRYFAGATAPFSWQPETVEVLASGTLALSTGPVFLLDGSRAGRFVSIWRREPDGAWRVVFDRGEGE